LFKSLIIIVLQQFKVDLTYIEKNLPIPTSVNRFFTVFYVFDCFVVLSSPFINCADIPDVKDYLIDISLQTFYLAPISIVSLLLLLKLKRQFTFGNLRKVIKRFYVLEIIIQLLIWGRLTFSSSF